MKEENSMEMFEMSIPTKLYVGPGSLDRLQEAAAKMGNKAFIVTTGGDMAKFGVLGRVTGLLEKGGKSCAVFDAVTPNPKTTEIEAGAAAFKAAGCDFLIALGGGSSMRAVHAPGHSAGHFAFLEESSRALFVGDALGHLIADSGYVLPATPAPEFDGEASAASARRLACLHPTLLCFPHFGATDRVGETFDRFLATLELSLAAAEEVLVSGGGPGQLAARLLREMPPLKEGEERLLPGILEVNAAGMLHYLRKEDGRP